MYLDSANYGFEVQSSFYKGNIHILVACSDTVLGLCMMDLEYQITELLDSKKIPQAISLAEQLFKSQTDSDHSKVVSFLAISQKRIKN